MYFHLQLVRILDELFDLKLFRFENSFEDGSHYDLFFDLIISKIVKSYNSHDSIRLIWKIKFVNIKTNKFIQFVIVFFQHTSHFFILI